MQTPRPSYRRVLKQMPGCVATHALLSLHHQARLLLVSASPPHTEEWQGAFRQWLHERTVVDVAKLSGSQLAEEVAWAWTILANVSGGNWEHQPELWQRLAAEWRDRYHKLLF